MERPTGLPRGNRRIRKRKSARLGELTGVIEAIGTFLADAKSARLSELGQQHAEKVREIRAVFGEIEKLKSELPPLESALRVAKEKTARCRAQLAAVKGAKPRPERYPLPSEIETWRLGLESATEALRDAEAAESTVVAACNKVTTGIQPLADKLHGHVARVGALNDIDRPGLIAEEAALRRAVGRPAVQRSGNSTPS